MTTNFCFSTLACPQWTLDRILECARANRLGVDFRGIGQTLDVTTLPEFTAPRLSRTAAQFQELGVAVPCLNTSITLMAPDEKWSAMLEECRRTVTVAAAFGTTLYRIFGGSIPAALSRDEARSLAQRRLRQLLKIGRSIAPSCRPILETHDEWTTSAQVLQILGDFSPTEAAVLWDTEHPYRKGESPADTVAALGRARIAHVHMKDSVRVNGKNSPRLLGAGELPVAHCAAALRSIGYTGWFCLETEKRWHPEAPEPEQSIPQFADYMRKL